MARRKKTPPGTEAEVLVRSRRRCCLCFGLSGDDSEKPQGQIAHLDRDPGNPDLDNLAYLCLDHHARYDSHTSQSKGYKIGEVKRYRDDLYEHLARQRTRGACEDEPDEGPPRRDFSVEITEHTPDRRRRAPSYYELVLYRFRQRKVGTLFEFNFQIANSDSRAVTLQDLKVVAEVEGVRLEAGERLVEQSVQTARTTFAFNPATLLSGGDSPQVQAETVSTPFRVALKTSGVAERAPAELEATVIFTFLHGETREAQCTFTRRD